MKKIKSNKGITGIDITASIVVLIMAIGIIMSMYSKYIDNSKIVRRKTEANNIAIDFVEYIEKIDYEFIDSLFDSNNDGVDEVNKITAGPEDDIIDAFGINIKDVMDTIPNEYIITLYKQDEIDNISIKFKIEVAYNVKNINYNVSLIKVKTRIIDQVNLPDMEATEVKALSKENKNRYILKYSNSKRGYIETNISDNEWYSISGEKYPIVVYAEKDKFDLNGVIKLSDCSEIYLWVPRFGKVSEELYGFGYDTTNYMITYGNTGNKITEKDEKTGTETKYNIIGYKENLSKEISEVPKDFEGVSGKWVKVNSNLVPINNLGNEIEDENNILNILKTKKFTWNY